MIIYAVLFNPIEPNCVGGFDWRYKRDSVIELYKEYSEDSDVRYVEVKDISVERYHAKSEHITDWLDSMFWREGYFDFIGADTNPPK